MRRKLKREVFIVWVRDDLSRVVVPLLALELKRRGFKVIFDSVLKTSNQASLALWMARKIENAQAVICVVTPDLIELFELDPEEPSASHLGGQWEIRLLVQRLYDHGLAPGCPVIPVLPPGITAEDSPTILRILENTHFDHVTGVGITTVEERVNNVYDHSERVARNRQEPEERAENSVSSKETLAEELRHADPSKAHAHNLAKAWVKHARAEGVTHSGELVDTFKKIALIAQWAADLELLRQVTAICLPTVEQDDLDNVAKATYLIFGRAFLLCCDHEPEKAQSTVELALTLALDAEDNNLVAHAKRCLARILVRRDAECASHDERLDNLKRANAYAERSMTDFQESKSDGKSLAMIALAEVRLAQFRFQDDEQALEEAEQLSAEAARGFPDGRRHPYYEAMLLQAEVAIFTGRGDASALLHEMLRNLRSRVRQAEAFTALVGRGHLLLARLAVRKGLSSAQDEIAKARALFAKVNLQLMVDECDWLTVVSERKQRRLSAYDIEAMERHCPDPELRSRVAERGRTWPPFLDLWGRIGDRYWKSAIAETRGRR
ncbi:hypothetical protein AB0M48_17170 [Lentzea sp. NPDC051208]|uniref:hypothetical protein n=1 Tax=Lentzea sp. NPDC051208 TaxID=3154642 RepID=UPI003412EF7B